MLSKNSKLLTPNSRLKIIVIGTRGFPNIQGGVETHCECLYPYIVEAGAEVTTITRKTYGDASLKKFKGVNLLTIPNFKRSTLEAIVHTFFAVIKAKQIGCDILHIHAIGPALMVPFARGLGLKVIMTNHGPDYDRQKWGKVAKFMLKLGESLGSRFSHQVISISQTIAASLMKSYGCEAAIIPNGVEIPEIFTTERALNQFGLERGKYVLTVGRLVPEKGFHDLIDSWELGARSREGAPSSKLQIPNFKKLVIVGDADHEDEYSKGLRRKSRGVADVILTGRLTGDPLKELYSHAGLFVLPSYHEGLPIVLLEAMSYGLSCIVSDIPANRNVDLENYRFFKPGDIDGLAAKLNEFVGKTLSEEEKRHQIEYIRDNFDWEKIARKTLDVYKKVHS